MAGTAKRGRPRKPYRTTWGKYIDGLRRRSDGRWVIVDTGETFTEPDERRAVARFRRWEAEQSDSALTEISVPYDSFSSPAVRNQIVHATGASIYGDLTGPKGVSLETFEPMLWVWFREQLIARPEHVADKVGIPEIARLADLPAPSPSPTLAELGKLYQNKADVQKKQRQQSRLFWNDFCEWMAKHDVKTLRQLSPERVAEYGDCLRAGDHSPKYLKNRFTNIRGILNFARKRGLHAADLRHALDCCAVLTSPRRVGKRQPHPISRQDFHALLQHADSARSRAFLLCMLNLCMYPSEALGLDWCELDLDKKNVVTDRAKTAVIRIGVLWNRTVAALRELKPDNALPESPVFLSAEGTRWHPNTAGWRFRKIRDAADLPKSVKAEHCRDGAYTAAVEAGVELTQAKLLAGHATGIPDYYAQRRPTMVAAAIASIEEAYFG